jgi:hypothetical protein
LFQNIVVTVVSLLVTGLAIGAMWLIWFRLGGGPRRWWTEENQAQMRNRNRNKNNNEILSLGQRFGELVSVVIVLLIFGFYVYHQVANTGFFTSNFGVWEMFAFYGSILVSLIPPISRALIGRRNPVRPIEAFCNLFFAFASLCLLFVFPFNATHFAYALPTATRFAFSWVTNDIARIVLVLMFIGGMISAFVNIVRYLTFTPLVKEERREQATNSAIPV